MWHLLFMCMATSVYMWPTLACSQSCCPSYLPPSAYPTSLNPSYPYPLHPLAYPIAPNPPSHQQLPTIILPNLSQPVQSPLSLTHSTIATVSLQQLDMQPPYAIPHYFPIIATLHATINISNSTVLFLGLFSSILIVITIVSDCRLLHDTSLQCCSST